MVILISLKKLMWTDIWHCQSKTLCLMIFLRNGIRACYSNKVVCYSSQSYSNGIFKATQSYSLLYLCMDSPILYIVIYFKWPFLLKNIYIWNFINSLSKMSENLRIKLLCEISQIVLCSYRCYSHRSLKRALTIIEHHSSLLNLILTICSK